MDFVFDPSLVLYLPLYQLDGASFVSKDAHGHLCSVTGALWRPNGRYFDGTDDYITLGNISAVKFSNTDRFSIYGWARKKRTATAQWLWGKRLDAGTYRGWDIEFTATDALGIAMDSNNGTGNSIWITSADTFTDTDRFMFLGFSYDGSSAASGFTAYVDGEEISMSITADGLTATCEGGASFVIGARNTTGIPIKADVGEVLVYNRALTPQETQNIYLATKWRYR